jgi:cytochrome bd-type quinol oxidase subunit 1
MTASTKKILMVIVVVAAVVVAVTGYRMYNKGPVNVADAEAIKATPAALYTSYTLDSAAAQKKYDGKVLELTGQITDVSENSQKQQVILLKTSSSGGNINCTMEESVAGARAGDNITIRGICSGIGQGDADLGILGDVYLTRCLISNK